MKNNVGQLASYIHNTGPQHSLWHGFQTMSMLPIWIQKKHFIIL